MSWLSALNGRRDVKVQVLKTQSNTPSVRSQMDSVKEFRDGLWPNEQWGSNLSKALNQLIASSC